MKPIKDWTEEDVIEFRIRADGWIRKMIIGTYVLCSLAIIAAWAWQQLK